MTAESAPAELVLHPNASGVIAGFLLFGGTGTLLAYRGVWFGWVGVAIGIGMLVVLLWTAFSSRSRLYLSRDGLRFGSMRRVSAYRWSDIARFFPSRATGTNRVCLTSSRDFTGEMKIRRINQNFAGFDRFLPNNYGMGADELAQLLESWRIRYAETVT